MKAFMKPLSKEEFELVVASAAKLLGTSQRPVIIPGEAIWGIEAFARNTAAPGRVFLNIVTGPYGKMFGQWLREGGAEVYDLETGYDEVVSPDAVERAIKNVHPCALSFVQTEAITGGANPTKEILQIAENYGLITIIDAVSSIGADEIYMDDWGVDFIAAGMQKALNGPNGISFMGVSKRGFEFMRSNPKAPHGSILSLTELYDQELCGVPEHLPVLETRGAIEAFREIEREGLANICTRHKKAAEAARAGVKALGLGLWQKDERGCTNLNTTVVIPETEAAADFNGEGIVTPGNGELRTKLLRVNHYGSRADIDEVEKAIDTLAHLAEIPADDARVSQAKEAARQSLNK